MEYPYPLEHIPSYMNVYHSVRSNFWPMLVTTFIVTQNHHQYETFQINKDGRIYWHPHYLSKNDSTKQISHRHSFYELVYVRSGELTHHVEQRIFHYQTGDAILLNQGIQHIEGFETSCEVVFIGLYPDYFYQLLHENPVMPENSQYEYTGIPNFLAHSNTEHSRQYLDFVYTFEQRQNGRQSPVTPLMNQLLETMQNRSVGYGWQAQALLLQICAFLEDPTLYHMQHVSIDDSTEALLYKRILRFLEERNGRITRSELGEAMHYNGDYLNRIVKNQSGHTIHELGQQITVQTAVKLLETTKLPIAEIIRQLGYSNQAYFYNLFRSVMHCSPAEYRRGVIK